MSTHNKEQLAIMANNADPTLDHHEKGFFRPYVTQVTTHVLPPGLKNTADPGNSPILTEFAKLKSDYERMKFVSSLPFVHTLQLDRYTKTKNLEEAKACKTRGNSCFGKAKYLDAVLEYTRGILVAPWPGQSKSSTDAEGPAIAHNGDHQPSTDSAHKGSSSSSLSPKDDEESQTILSVILANRSAGLFRLGLHDECLEDINEALKTGYPAKLRHKLLERAGSCYLEKGDFVKAEEEFRMALELEEKSFMKEDAKDAKQHEQWMKGVQEKLAMVGKQKMGLMKKMSQTGFLDDENPECPEFAKSSGGANTQFPSFSKAVGVQYGETTGRFTVAEKDIKAGETVAIENPIVSCIMTEKRGVYCSHCLKRFLAPYPCERCSLVAFCSKECRQIACGSYHQYECEILRLLDASGMSITCSIALRIVTQAGLKKLRELETEWQAGGKTLVHDRENEQKGGGAMAGMDDHGNYDPNSYHTIYSMVDHCERRKPADIFHKGLMALFLVKSLQLTRFFGEGNRKDGNQLAMKPSDDSNEVPQLSEDELFIAGLLLRNLQIVQFNVHEISEFRMKSPNEFKGANSVSIGAGIYPTVCLMNHSCNPGIVRYFLGSKMVVKSLNNLRPGDAINENYGPVFTRMPKEERQTTLKARYWFDCSCEACIEDWPMYSEMTAKDELRLVCKKCRSRITESQVMAVASPVVKCATCGLSTNVLKVLKMLQGTEANFKNAMGLVEAGETREAMKAFFSLLDDLDGTLQPPYKDFHLCQEFIRRCMLTMGSHWYPGKLRFS